MLVFAGPGAGKTLGALLAFKAMQQEGRLQRLPRTRAPARLEPRTERESERDMGVKRERRREGPQRDDNSERQNILGSGVCAQTKCLNFVTLNLASVQFI